MRQLPCPPTALPAAMTLRLEAAGVRVELPDPHTAVLRSVPLDPERFNKSTSNVLVKRPAGGLPFVLGVDRDLEYRGADSRLAQAFAAGPRRQGWLLIRLGPAGGELAAAVGRALATMGFDGGEPALPAFPDPLPGRLLATFAEELAADRRSAANVGRDEEVDVVRSSFEGWAPRLPVIVGPAGAGKRQLLVAVAHRLAAARRPRRLLAVGLGALFAGTLFDGERESLLDSLLAEAAASPATVLALERVDLAVSEAPHGPFLLARALDHGVALVGSTLPDFARTLRAVPLDGRWVLVAAPAAGPGRTLDVLRAVSSRVAEHHGVTIGDHLLEPLLQRAEELPGALPGKAVTLLDAAAGRARLSGAAEVDLIHLHLAVASGGATP